MKRLFSRTLLAQTTLLCLSPLLLVSQFLYECVAGFELSWNVVFLKVPPQFFQLFQTGRG